MYEEFDLMSILSRTLGLYAEEPELKADLLETRNAYILRMNVPGIKKEDLRVSMKNGYLTINVNYVAPSNPLERYIVQERQSGQFSRSFYIDKNITSKDVKADVEDGVLTVTMAKLQAIKEKKGQDKDFH